MAKATPTPWRIGALKTVDQLINSVPNGAIIIGNAADLDRAEDGETVQAVCMISRIDEYNDQDKANAELIVKAVNRDHLFDELVEALGNGLNGMEVFAWCEKYSPLLQKAKAAK